MTRFLDIVFSCAALVLLCPILLPIGCLLRFTGEGEIFFAQARVGLGGKPFQLFKFATMLKDSPTLGTGTVTLKDDPRVLPIGKFLRKTKINELPQLWNIVIGDMSVIGPRPQTQRCFDAFPEAARVAIVQVRPGLSGVGSVLFRDEENMLHASADPDAYYDGVIMPFKGLVEQWYVDNQGLKLYLVSILATAWAILFPRSSILWRLTKGLPTPPPELRDSLNYPASS